LNKDEVGQDAEKIKHYHVTAEQPLALKTILAYANVML